MVAYGENMIDTSPRKCNSSPLKNGSERKITPFLLKNGGLFSGATQENFQKVIHLNVGCDQKEGAFFWFFSMVLVRGRPAGRITTYIMI